VQGQQQAVVEKAQGIGQRHAGETVLGVHLGILARRLPGVGVATGLYRLLGAAA
jgi:hypothetical protein